MRKIICLFSLLALLYLSACDNSSKQNAEAQKAAVEEKEAIVLDSITNVLEQEKANIEMEVQKLEEGLKAIEE